MTVLARSRHERVFPFRRSRAYHHPMDTPTDFVAELQAEGLDRPQAEAAAVVLSGMAPPAAIVAGGLYSHDLAAIRRRVEVGQATNDDAAALLADHARLSQIIGLEVNDPDVRAALTAARARKNAA